MSGESLAVLAREAARSLEKLADEIDRRSAARAAARDKAPTPPSTPQADSTTERHDNPVAPFGRCKGLPLDELADDDLSWLAGRLEQSLSDPEKSGYAAKDAAALEAVRREQARR